MSASTVDVNKTEDRSEMTPMQASRLITMAVDRCNKGYEFPRGVLGSGAIRKLLVQLCKLSHSGPLPRAERVVLRSLGLAVDNSDTVLSVQPGVIKETPAEGLVAPDTCLKYI